MMQFQKMCLYILGMLVMSTVYNVVSAELVKTQRVVIATLGENVNLRCELSKPKDVLQVTWQKTKGQSFENVATYNKRFGAKITDAFRDRVTVTQVGTDVSCITIHGVTKEDETCYSCLFNAYPEGAIIGRTCLSVYEIYEPHLEVESISKPESGHEEVKSITCSVTGKPVASISWNATEDVIVNPQQYSVVNPNGTITVICNASVLPSRISNKEVVVTCKVTHPGLTREKQTSRVISAPAIESYLEKNISKPPTNAVTIGLICGLLLSVVGVVGILKFCWKKNGKKPESAQKRFPKDNESESVSENHDPLRTPLNKSFNTGQTFESPLRYRSTPLKNKSFNGCSPLEGSEKTNHVPFRHMTPSKNKSPSKSLLSDQSPALKNTTPEKKEAKSKRAIHYYR
ncbi:OX-2 membrane glycoprotein-like [Acipenser oxyrinchus oxyrinchus]|uniref:OX-2 membrane glycoprotein-like n=1 Tax=Acipenser oxyrinchus oxyrinchus TaxID=40147 RepID=A0AAD8DFU1_ACIOX|nr:OX-2 membrane glycoprotein-like [Acipenser oxyrinchus oxyrinchus]